RPSRGRGAGSAPRRTRGRCRGRAARPQRERSEAGHARSSVRPYAECYHRLMRVYALLATGLLLAAPGLSAQNPPSQPPAQQSPQQGPPVIRSGINFVSVDVIVTDKKSGDVVLDMKQDDFEVREDKKPQTIQTFDRVRIEPLTADAAPPHAITSVDE